MKVLSTTTLKQLLNLIKTNFFMRSEAEEVQTIDIDSTPTSGSENPVASGGVKTALDAKSTVTVASGGSSTNQVNYITIDNTEYKMSPDEFTAQEVSDLWDQTTT